MKPIIGITPEIAEDGKVSLNYAYTHAIETAGGIPLVLPCTEDEGLLNELAALCHGFVFSGGEDIDPSRYGEEKRPQCGQIAHRRDAFDLAMFEKALAACLNSAFGVSCVVFSKFRLDRYGFRE